MTLALSDWAAISPLLILLMAALILLLIESVGNRPNHAFSVALIAALAALVAAAAAPPSENPLLIRWLNFDPPNRFFAIFFVGVGIASLLLASAFFRRFQATQGEYYFLLFSSIFGSILIGASADFLTLFIGLETLSISLYILCAYMKKWTPSHEASIKYFLMGSAAAAFFLYGVALVYGAVGTTQFAGLMERYRGLVTLPDQALFLGGMALITLGLAFKAAVVPFHLWAPDVYHGSPTPVAAFMAVGTKGAAFAALARLFLLVVPRFHPLWPSMVAWLAIFTLIYANVVALRQTQMRRFFAYSGIAHAGFLLIALVVDSPEAFQALCFYLVVYASATLGSFAILARVDQKPEGPFFDDLRGLFYRAPLGSVGLTLFLLTLAGLPPTAGFFAKFYLLKLAFASGYTGLVCVGLLTTIFSVFYYLRIVSLLFATPIGETPLPRAWPAIVVGWGACAAIVALSVYPEPLLALFTP